MMSPESGEPTVPSVPIATTAGQERPEVSNEAIEAMDTKEDSTVAKFAGKILYNPGTYFYTTDRIHSHKKYKYYSFTSK